MGLAGAIGLEVTHSEVVSVGTANPRTFLGAGRVAELEARVAGDDAGLVVVDGPLTGGQQRNLERALRAKVIDRTGLILEIFGARARTREGALQVELAALLYQRGRLVRSWTHLERQRGGFGFLGGPGETQIEADRRHIDERVARIRRELGRTTRTRRLHRENRARVPWPVVALVGYTNAGKSTLFNLLTGSSVFAEDQLFATLDPTMRSMEADGGARTILSDTVGFISELPPSLVAAFRATLEEVVHADLILHVRDISHEESEDQKRDVLTVLSDLGIDANEPGRILEVRNKIDLLPPEARAWVGNAASREGGAVAVSATTGEGQQSVRTAVSAALAASREVIDVDVPLRDGATLAWLYDHGVVRRRHDRAGAARLTVELGRADVGRLRKRRLAAE